MKAFLSNPSSCFAETFLDHHYIQKDYKGSTFEVISLHGPTGPLWNKTFLASFA
jgi:hypothetical protein